MSWLKVKETLRNYSCLKDTTETWQVYTTHDPILFCYIGHYWDINKIECSLLMDGSTVTVIIFWFRWLYFGYAQLYPFFSLCTEILCSKGTWCQQPILKWLFVLSCNFSVSLKSFQNKKIKINTISLEEFQSLNTWQIQIW